MPDFEALIRHQQSKNPSTNKRLKIVGNSNNKIDEQEEYSPRSWKMLSYFAVGFMGSMVGGLTILFFEVNKFIPTEIFKIK